MMTTGSFVHYTFGIPVLDEKHWEIFQTLTEVVKCLKHNECVKCAPPCGPLKVLNDQFVDHVAEEDSMMDESDYPYAKWHKEEHIKMIKAIAKMDDERKLFRISNVTIAMFENAFINHIDNSDRQLAEWYLKFTQQK